MFQKPKYVFKDGMLVCKDGDICGTPVGGVHTVETDYDSNIKKYISGFYEKNIFSNFADAEIGNDELQLCANGGKILLTSPN